MFILSKPNCGKVDPPHLVVTSCIAVLGEAAFFKMLTCKLVCICRHCLSVCVDVSSLPANDSYLTFNQ